MTDLRLDWCSHAAASYAATHWHYQRTLPTPPYVRVGVWEDAVFIGCVLFSRGAARHSNTPFAVERTEIAELTRVALREHSASVSRIVAIALRLLRQRCPDLRLVVSFADPAAGHHGGIYQAGGWIYLGQQSPTVEYIGPDRKRWHGRMISPTGRKKVYGRYRSVFRPDQCEKVTCPGKHKYVMPLDVEMREQIKPLAKPYPRRPRLESEAPVLQTGDEDAAMRSVGSTQVAA